MSSMTKRMFATVGLATLALAGMPTLAMAGGARLYEMTENMKLTKGGKFERRKATSELIGTADVGTALCPAELVAIYAPGAKTCTVNATGSDNISLGTGRGPFQGTYTVVVQGDNNADSPEFVIAKGVFTGKMDFAPAILMGIPLGHVTGKITDIATMKTTPFTGTFRLPFVIAGVTAAGGVCTPSPKDATCFPVNDAFFFGGAATPLQPMERYDLTTATRPLYMSDDGSVVPVGSSEFGGGWAAVKFEINF
jgi:hypothetical protein